MLILSAKPKQERIVVDDRVEISVLKVVGNRVYLAIHGVEGSTIDRLSVAKSKRDYESPFDELFERLEEDRDGAAPGPRFRANSVSAPVGRDEHAQLRDATTLRERKERRRLAVERELDEIAATLERVAECVAFDETDAEASDGADEIASTLERVAECVAFDETDAEASDGAAIAQDFHDFID